MEDSEDEDKSSNSSLSSLSASNISVTSSSFNLKVNTDATAALGVCRRTSLVKVCKLCWHLLCDVMIIIFILSSVLGVVTNSNQPKVRAAPRPRPFIIGGNVKDYYQGNVFQTFKDARKFENSLLMYYAAWDRESQEARSVLLEIGEFFSQTDILVAGVNCWYPTSDCAKEFGGKSSGTRYPVFIFYPSAVKGIQYRGEIRADHIISWIQRCRYPLTQLLDQEHFNNLHTEHEHVLVGYLPDVHHDPNYVSLLQCAHYLLETDKDTMVLVTSDQELARSLHLHVNHPLRLFSWNTSYSYPNKTIDSGKCNQWTVRHVTSPTTWIQLPARKSLVMSHYLGDHSLLVFAARTAMQTSHVETIVREVALRYHDCNSSSTVTDLVTRLRHKLSQEPSLPDRCQPSPELQHCQLRSFSSVSTAGGHRPLCLGVTAHNVTQNLCHSSSASTNSADGEINFLIHESLTERTKSEQYLTPLKWRQVIFSDQYNASSDPLAGLSCADNRTVNIVLVDTAHAGYSLLADSLGVQLLDDRPSVAMLSVAEESVAVIPVGHDNLTQALETALLGWHSSYPGGQYGLRTSEHSDRVQVGSDTTSHCHHTDTESCVMEVTRQTFEEKILQANKSTVLLYTSSYCSQCSVSGHVLHNVASLLHEAGVYDVQFLMMESTRNDPPLHFTALAYPSIIFFPHGRTHNSRVFPFYKELNVTSLLNFILSNLSSKQRLSLALSSCDIKCLQKLKLNAAMKLSSLEMSRRRWTQYRWTQGHKQLKHVRSE